MVDLQLKVTDCQSEHCKSTQTDEETNGVNDKKMRKQGIQVEHFERGFILSLLLD